MTYSHSLAWAAGVATVGLFAQVADGIADAAESNPMDALSTLVNAGVGGLLLIAVVIFTREAREARKASDQRDRDRDDAAATRERERDEAQEKLFASYEKQVEGFKTFVNTNNRELIGLTREMIIVTGEVKNAVRALEDAVYGKFRHGNQVADLAVAVRIDPPVKQPPDIIVTGAHDTGEHKSVTG